MSSASFAERLSSGTGGFAARLNDIAQLAKLRIAVMAMAAVTVGFLLGSQGSIDLVLLAHAELGILCVALSSSLLNQWLETETDRLMKRTADRPLPAGRIRPGEVLWIGLALGSLGSTWLWAYVNLTVSVLSALTIALYVGVYTPLKRHSSLCTVVGAIPGALPPVLGWVAAGGRLDMAALSLFLVLFAWQFPHFLAIATIYREDYEGAGLKMLPLRKDGQNLGGVIGAAYAVVLIPISLLVWQQGIAGPSYAMVAVIGGIAYLISSIRFFLTPSKQRARELMVCSIVYLPTLLGIMTWDHFRLLT